MHYQRVRKTGAAGSAESAMTYYDGCSVDGCERKHVGKGYCGMHLARIQRDGEPGAADAKVAATGEGHVSVHGYRVVRQDGRPVHHHRVVMEEALGRRLWPDENVHHINGDRLDNRIENLELWSTSQPSGQRVEDKLAWAHEIIARYAAVMA